MKKIVTFLICLVLVFCSRTHPEKDLEIREKKLISNKPPFTLTLPSEFEWMYSSSVEYPKENSLTRSYFFIKQQDHQVEEIFIVQIADKTNPQAEPINPPSLRPFSEKRMYLKGKIKGNAFTADYLIQRMVWNPNAPSLQPIVKKGIVIPSRWVLQGQFLFVYLGEHAVFIRYAKDINTFGLKISEEEKDWERESIAGNEKSVYETFKKEFIEMMNSIQVKSP